MSDFNWNAILDEQAKDPGIGTVPANRYPVRVKSAEAVTASTGARMLKMQCEIVGGPYDTRVLYTNIVFTTSNAKAMSFTLRKLAAFGVTKEVLAAQNPSLAQIAQMMTGTTAEAEVEVGAYNGEPKNDIKTFRPLSGDVPAPPTPGVPGLPTPTVPTPTAGEAPPIPTPTPPAPQAPAVSSDGPSGDPF